MLGCQRRRAKLRMEPEGHFPVRKASPTAITTLACPQLRGV